MATRDYLLSFQGASALPEDRYVNVLHFADDNTVPDRQRIMDSLHNLYLTHMQPRYSSEVRDLTIKCYPPGLNPGGPELETTYAFMGASGDAPHEVALCLSYFATFNQPRLRGRTYLGPIGSGSMSARPSTILIQSAVDLGVGFGAIGGWLQRSVTPVEDYKPVTNLWVDNAWDTMRSRGLSPSGRVEAAV